MVKRDQLPGLKSMDLEFFQHCLSGKQKRVNFLKMGHEKNTSPLELVYSDVFGPTKVTSLGRVNYFVTFLDDCTRRVWIFMLNRKFEDFSKFKIFKTFVENQSGHNIKCLQTDNGSEFFSLEFDNFCTENGIQRIKDVPFKPQ